MSNKSLEQRNREVAAKLDLAAANMAKDAESRLAYDFDKALEEYQEEVGYVTIRICGENIDIVKQPPLRVMKAILALTREQGGSQDKFALYTKFLGQILNDRLTQKVMQSDASFDFVVNRLVPELFKIWGLESKSEGDDESGGQKASGA